MGVAVVRGGVDTWAGEGNPSANHVASKSLKVRTSSPEAFAYLFFKNPAPRGANIISAWVRVYGRDTGWGSQTMRLRRLVAGPGFGKLTYNNRPGTTGTSIDVTQTNPADATEWAFEVTTHLQTITDGAANYGWRLETTTSTAERQFYSLDAPRNRPTLTVQWSDKPDAPTDLSPAGGRAVSVSHPVLRFSYNDPSGQDPLSAVQVQIDAAGNFVTPGFDSGEVSATEPELDLASTAYAGLSDLASTQWRVRVKDAVGNLSLWSDPATFSRDNQGSLAINNPAASPNNVVTEPTPPFAWALTGETQEAWANAVLDAATNVELYNTGKTLGADTSHTPPGGVLKDGRTYRLRVRTWDTKDREATPGAPVYVEQVRDFTLVDEAGVTGPGTLTADQDGDTPWVVLTFTRSSFPDSWVVRRGGVVIADNLDPADTFTSGTTHTFTDYTAARGVAYTYRVQAVVNGQASSGGPTDTVTTDAEGTWLADPDEDLFVMFRAGSIEAANGEVAEVFTPLSRSRPTRITQSLRGLEGTLSGMLVNAVGRTIAEWEADLMVMKSTPDRRLRLAVSDLNIPVVIGAITTLPIAHTRGEAKRVDVAFWQTGELPFEADL